MWKKIAIFALAFLISLTGISGNSMEVRANDIGEEVDASELLTEDALIGYTEQQTKGPYLASGYSVIKDGGVGKIIAGGGTNSSTRCRVSLNVVVERLEGGSWYRVTSWTITNENALSAISSRVLSVGRGYYYRVRCIHYAGSDSSSSMTSSFLV